MENEENNLTPSVPPHFSQQEFAGKYGPVPASSSGGISFDFKLKPNEYISMIEAWVFYDRIRQLKFTTSKGRTLIKGSTTRTRTTYRQLIGPFSIIKINGGAVSPGSRVTGMWLKNTYGQELSIGWENSESAYALLLNDEYIETIFGRSGSDIDQLGLVVKEK